MPPFGSVINGPHGREMGGWPISAVTLQHQAVLQSIFGFHKTVSHPVSLPIAAKIRSLPMPTGRLRAAAVILTAPNWQRSFGGFSVELIRTDEDGEFDNTRMGIGQPFYFSWSPDGQQVLTQRNNRRLDIYDLDSGEFERLSQRPGSIQAPAWSPVDDRLLVGIRNDTTFRTDLVILADSKTTTLREEIPGLISFNWSPDGNYIAFRTVNDNQISPVTVIDSISGEVVAQSNMNNVYAFFWSPDSQLIAMATIATPSGSFNARDNVVLASSAAAQQSPELAWAVLDIELAATRRYGAFQPTSDMIYMFNFFDQFAQSHQIWSPDSTHIVFSEINDQGTPTISILDMTRPDTVPFFIAEGYVGIWSYD